MNIKRALWMGALAYVVSFALGIVGAMILGVDLMSVQEPPLSLWIFGIAATIPLVGMFAWWYFRSETTTASPKEGFFLGLMFIGIGFLIDALIIVPTMLFSDAPQDPMLYYLNPLFWLTLVLLVVTTTAVGSFLGKK